MVERREGGGKRGGGEAVGLLVWKLGCWCGLVCKACRDFVMRGLERGEGLCF